MHIKKILRQHRRDFTAIYRCGGCGHEHEASGYDDTHFHSNVVPNMRCEVCGKTENKPLTPKYPDGVQI